MNVAIHHAAQQGRVALVAALLAGGCPRDRIDAAFRYLEGRPIPDTAAELVARLDEAIAYVTDIRSDR